MYHTLSCLEHFRLAGATNATIETTEGDDLLVFLDGGKVCVGLCQLPSYVNGQPK